MVMSDQSSTLLIDQHFIVRVLILIKKMLKELTSFKITSNNIIREVSELNLGISGFKGNIRPRRCADDPQCRVKK